MIYFIHGPDTYRSKTKLNELIKKYSGEFELQKIDGEHIKHDEFISKLNAVSLLASKRLIVIENLSTNKLQKEITDSLKDKKISDSDVLIFHEQKVNKVTSLYKFLSHLPASAPTTLKGNQPNWTTAGKLQYQTVFEFNELNNAELKKWALDYIKNKKGKIDVVALEELLMGSNNNLWYLSRELDKLLAYKKHITLENVMALTPANFDDNIFNLSDAIGRGDKKVALELINKQLDAGAAPIYLLSMIVRQFRILIQVKEALGKSNFPNNSLIAKEIGLHPFVVQKSMGQTQKYSFEELEKIYQRLLELDLKLKSSKLSAESLFNRFVISN